MKTLKVLTIINLVCALIVFGVVLLLDKKIYNLKHENNQLQLKCDTVPGDSTGSYQTGATGMIKDFPTTTGQRVTYFVKSYTKGNNVYIVYYPKINTMQTKNAVEHTGKKWEGVAPLQNNKDANNNVAIGYEPLTLPEDYKCYIRGASGELYDRVNQKTTE